MATISVLPMEDRDTLQKKVEHFHYARLESEVESPLEEETARANQLTEVYDGGQRLFTIHVVPGTLVAVKPRSESLKSIAEDGYLFLAEKSNPPRIEVTGSNWESVLE